MVRETDNMAWEVAPCLACVAGNLWQETNMFNIAIRLTAAIARYTGNQKTLLYEIENNCDLAGLLERLGHDFPDLKNNLCDKEGRIIDSVNVYVNGDNVRYAHGKKTKLNAGDEVDIIPAVAAG